MLETTGKTGASPHPPSNPTHRRGRRLSGETRGHEVSLGVGLQGRSSRSTEGCVGWLGGRPLTEGVERDQGMTDGGLELGLEDRRETLVRWGAGRGRGGHGQGADTAARASGAAGSAGGRHVALSKQLCVRGP